MPKSDTRKPAKPAKDYSAHYHKFYAPPEIILALDGLAALNKQENRRHKSRSAILLAKTCALLRAEAPRLRRAGVAVPESLFTE